MPYEAIDDEEFERMYRQLKPLDLSAAHLPTPGAVVAEEIPKKRKHTGVQLPDGSDNFCDSDRCERL